MTETAVDNEVIAARYLCRSADGRSDGPFTIQLPTAARNTRDGHRAFVEKLNNRDRGVSVWEYQRAFPGDIDFPSDPIENRVTPIKSVTIFGREIKPEVGSIILIGDQLVSDRLLPGDETVDSGYRGSQFRIDRPGLGGSLPADVEITGRTMQRRPYQTGFWVKIKIIWVGDCGPDETSNGWLLVN